MATNKYIYRNLARIVLEATTPLAVGSGENNIMTDALVATDVNGLPYIPGTTIAGVLRHALGYKNEDKNDFFGYQLGKENHGSEIMFSEARLVGADGKPVDGIHNDVESDPFLKHYLELPIRQHVRISHKGTAEDAGKFDEQVVFKGSRFCFDIEQASWEKDKKFQVLLDKLYAPDLRLGGGVYKGFGELKVVSCKTISLDLRKEDDLKKYLEYDTNLTSEFPGSSYDENSGSSSPAHTFELTLKAEDFFLMGSGYGDQDADMTPVKESYVEWNGEKGTFKEQGVLIPATSLKGALAHRVAYYANLQEKKFADKVEDFNAFAEQDNPVVTELFGCAGNGKDSSEIQPGKVLFSDIIQPAVPANYDKILNHVMIDRFTGGTIDSALFAEKTTYGKVLPEFTIKLIVKQTISEKAHDALVNALTDLCNGMLPLGGGTARGNGVFTGTLKEKGETIYPKENK